MQNLVNNSVLQLGYCICIPWSFTTNLFTSAGLIKLQTYKTAGIDQELITNSLSTFQLVAALTLQMFIIKINIISNTYLFTRSFLESIHSLNNNF